MHAQTHTLRTPPISLHIMYTLLLRSGLLDGPEPRPRRGESHIPGGAELKQSSQGCAGQCKYQLRGYVSKWYNVSTYDLIYKQTFSR